MSTNLEYRERNREKEKVGYRSGKLNEKTSDREPEQEIKTKESNFVEKTTWKFCSGCGKMRNARGHNKKKMKMSGSEKKVNKKRYDISSKERVTSRVSGSFTLKSCKTTAKKCKKNVLHVQSCSFLALTLDLLLFFHRSRCLRRLALHDFVSCLSKLWI